MGVTGAGLSHVKDALLFLVNHGIVDAERRNGIVNGKRHNGMIFYSLSGTYKWWMENTK